VINLIVVDFDEIKKFFAGINASYGDLVLTPPTSPFSTVKLISHTSLLRYYGHNLIAHATVIVLCGNGRSQA